MATKTVAAPADAQIRVRIDKWTGGTPPAPGQYLARFDISIATGSHGLQTTRYRKALLHWDGKQWEGDARPDFFRDLPA